MPPSVRVARDRVTKVDTHGNSSTFVEHSNGSNGLGFDGKPFNRLNDLVVEVFSPKGAHLGVIPIGVWGGESFMLRKPQNLAFSGPDRKTLYTVGSNAIFKVQLLSQGLTGRAK